MKITMMLAVALVAAARFAAAGQDKAPAAKAEAAPVTARVALEELKALAGTWEGPGMEAAGPKMSITYRVISAGTTVLETLFPGTPHEMITLYTLDGDDLVLTHYCAGGNQPRMKLDLKTSTAKDLHFDFTGGTNLTADGMHMHEGKIRLIDADHVESQWTTYQAGKAMDPHTFSLSRAK